MCVRSACARAGSEVIAAGGVRGTARRPGAGCAPAPLATQTSSATPAGRSSLPSKVMRRFLRRPGRAAWLLADLERPRAPGGWGSTGAPTRPPACSLELDMPTLGEVTLRELCRRAPVPASGFTLRLTGTEPLEQCPPRG